MSARILPCRLSGRRADVSEMCREPLCSRVALTRSGSTSAWLSHDGKRTYHNLASGRLRRSDATQSSLDSDSQCCQVRFHALLGPSALFVCCARCAYSCLSRHTCVCECYEVGPVGMASESKEDAEHHRWMGQALQQAYKALDYEEVPVGCVIVDDRTHAVIAQAFNRTNIEKNVGPRHPNR